jgi:hypothetical protein
VRATAIDAAARGMRTRVVLDLGAGVSPGTTARATADLMVAGVEPAPSSCAKARPMEVVLRRGRDRAR